MKLDFIFGCTYKPFVLQWKEMQYYTKTAYLIFIPNIESKYGVFHADCLDDFTTCCITACFRLI